MELDPLGDFNEGPSKRKVYEVDYESLSQAEVEKQMQGDVDYITSLFGVTVSGMLCCHTICAHFVTVGRRISPAAVLRLEQGEAHREVHGQYHYSICSRGYHASGEGAEATRCLRWAFALIL